MLKLEIEMDQYFPLIIITSLRLLIPLIILRKPFLGGLASFLLDFADLGFLNLFGIEYYDFPPYQLWDKILDMYYLFLAFYVSLSWHNPVTRKTSIILFLHRLLGFILFLVTRRDLFLFLLPNVFEYFYLYYLGYLFLFKNDPFTSFRKLAVPVFIIIGAKIIQEYVLHIGRQPVWQWVKTLGQSLVNAIR
ncbi:MAG: hypothetical protein ACOX6V_02820 [Patescibacteria group bacterium]